MSTVSQSSRKRFVVKMRSMFLCQSDTTKRKICRGQSFGHHKQIRFNAPMIHSKPFPCSSNSRHDLITNEKNTVFIAELTNTRKIIFWRDNKSIGTSDRFHQDRRNTFWILEHQGLFDLVKKALCKLFITISFSIKMRSILVGIENANNSCHWIWFNSPPTWITCERHCTKGCAMVSSVSSNNLVSSGDGLCKFDCILIGVSST
mmetsp:Transcript_22167/g.30472  ORF Transcript_22167/g.30472 Transcript_22167/m.30472 type:complete len:204 (+) Transcript_22167:439-1050(+)